MGQSVEVNCSDDPDGPKILELFWRDNPRTIF